MDKKTEKSLGEFPIDRSHFSTFFKKVSKFKPRYIILKFFFDTRKEDDYILISTLKKMNNVFTQAFSYQNESDSKLEIFKTSIGKDFRENSDLNDLIYPYLEMANLFAGVGFVNGAADGQGIVKDFEIVSNYKGKLYPLPLLILENELKSKSKIRENYLYLGDKKIKLKSDLGMGLKLNSPGSYKKVSMIDLIKGKIDEESIKGKTLIVFYDGEKISLTKMSNGFSYNPAEIMANAIDFILKK